MKVTRVGWMWYSNKPRGTHTLDTDEKIVMATNKRFIFHKEIET